MSRRSMFLLAAAVVLLYFSIILFMLSPLHGTRSSYYGGSYMNHLSLRQIPSVNWCKELQFKSPPSPNVVALVSYPGSGNTWLRYLLQQVTGIVTGSIYMDYGLRVHGFPAENVTDGSVLVVKTHEAPPLERNKFHSAVMLIRNPRDAILADFNRLHKGHIGTAPKSAFMKKSQDHKKTEWSIYVFTQLSVWGTFHQLWLTRFRGPVHVVFYEMLVRDTHRTIESILQFVNHNVTEADMKCAMTNREGIYRRRKKLQDFDPYTPDMYKSLDEVRNKVLRLITDYQGGHYESPYMNRYVKPTQVVDIQANSASMPFMQTCSIRLVPAVSIL